MNDPKTPIKFPPEVKEEGVEGQISLGVGADPESGAVFLQLKISANPAAGVDKPINVRVNYPPLEAMQLAGHLVEASKRVAQAEKPKIVTPADGLIRP